MISKFRRILGGSVALATVTSLATVFLNPPAAMAATLSASEKEIDINGQSFMQPYGMVIDGTTYMPVWYVIQALNKLGIDNTWDGKSWRITTASVQAPTNSGQGAIGIYVNNTLVYRVNGVTHKDPASGSETTYIPVYNIMQILKAAAINNTWDGHKWNIILSDSDSAGPQADTPGSIANFKGATNAPNQASDDSSYWSRASNDFYASAQTYEPTSDGPGPKLLNLEPGQTVYLSAYSHTKNVNDATWSVNSPDAKISPAYKDWSFWEENNKSMSEATFVASQPGVYTIQAAANGEYSVPLVLVVGLDKLSGSQFSITPGQDGIASLPDTLPASASVTADGTAGITEYVPYSEQADGWLPVKGKATSGTKSVVVEIMGQNNRVWNYMVPVNSDGTFGALLRVPFQSKFASVFIMPTDNYFHWLNSDEIVPNCEGYVVTLTGPAPSGSALGLLASAHMNYNASSEFNQIASVLMDNSASVETGVAAVSNFVSDKINYDWNSYAAGVNVWQSSTDAWTSNSGVCQDIAELTASLLRSIGLPTETVIGTAPKSANSDDHEWVQVQLGSNWLIMDPTWDSPARGNDTSTDFITSEYFTQTQSLSDSHTPDQNAIGTWR